uniref:Avirulence on Ve1 n=1 Tax=Verticillium dahliae TaxID=27337 RepID=H9DUR1_VERDA
MKLSTLGALISLTSLVTADLGTASYYNPPYLPTACGGSNPSQFPSGNLFVAVSDGLWDNGAACGRRYRIKCLSGARGSCKDGMIDVRVVDRAKTTVTKAAHKATMILSQDSYDAIVNQWKGTRHKAVNIEFRQI